MTVSVSAAADTSTAATDPTPRMPIWQPDTTGCWCGHHSAADHGLRWTGACISQHRSTNYAQAAAESKRSSRIATPSTCSAPMRWICRCDRPLLELVTTKEEPLPSSSPNSGADAHRPVDSVGVTTPAHARMADGRDAPPATFVRPGLGSLGRLDELGLHVVSQRLEAGRAVLACRAVETDEFAWCRVDTRCNLRCSRPFCVQHRTLNARGPLQPHRLCSGASPDWGLVSGCGRLSTSRSPGLRALAARLTSWKYLLVL
jgi:hypothetical protein